MCIIFFALSPPAIGERKYSFIMAANRDEYYTRPSQALSYWGGGDTGILGGRDLEPGRGNGTWLAINTDNGNFSALTNYRTATKYIGVKSRGLLVSDYLTSQSCAIEYTHKNFLDKSDQFGLSSLLVGNLTPLQGKPNIVYSTNAEQLTAEKPYEQITDGIHGLTNKTLNYPWTKLVTGKELFANVVANISKPQELITELQNILSNDVTHNPDPSIERMGWEDDWKIPLSAIHVRNINYRYGTRSSAVILVEDSGEGWYHERFLEGVNYDSHDFFWSEKCLKFKLKQ